MKFRIDENLPLEFVSCLVQEGYEALCVRDQRLSGCSDGLLFEVCQAESRILVTLDTDFANITSFRPEKSCGIIVFRLRSHDKITLLESLKSILPAMKEKSPANNLWIVEHDRIRVRD